MEEGGGEADGPPRVLWHLLSEFPSFGRWERLAWALLRARVKSDLRGLAKMCRRWARHDRRYAERQARIVAWCEFQ